MDTIREVLFARILRFQEFKAAGVTTPRFTMQLQSIINIYLETALGEPANLEETAKNIQALMDALLDYWARLFPDFDSATLLYSRMSSFRSFLERKLLEDYVDDMPYLVPPNFIVLARTQGDSADRERASQSLNIAVERMDEYYQERVVAVLHEMMIDPGHVGRKLQTAASKDGQPGSDIQPLIASCHWSDLATALVKDRVLVEKLFV